MVLHPEWRRRTGSWMEELKKHFFEKLGTAELEGFTTGEQLTMEEASTRQFEPAPEGSTWGGGKFDYGWFRCSITVPESAAGKRFVLRHGVRNTEGLVFVNGRAAGLLSSIAEEPFVLSRNAAAGERFDIVVEAYVGNAPRVCGGGPAAPTHETVPETHPSHTPVVLDTSFGTWCREAYQLWMDVDVLKDLLDGLPEESQRAKECEEALKDFTLLVDPEATHGDMIPGLRAARERLAPVLARKNGPSAPTLFAVGHGHLDVAWLWPLAETERKIARTLSNQLAVAEEFPFHRFVQSQPHLYWMLKRRYPELYERVKEAIAAGTICPDGGAWVEPDTNIPGGESLVRQFVYGKKFFREEFGVNSEVLWLPDTFGFSASLPQIMLGCGMKYFATGKIFWTYGGGDPFPHGVFTWRGIDGSEVLAETPTACCFTPTVAASMLSWKSRRTRDGRIDQKLFAYGYGDGGGGPSVAHLEYVRRQFDLEGCPKLRPAGLAESFAELEKKNPGEIHYVGEIYCQVHRGTLTSQAKIKLGNRRSELALRDAEMWSVAAAPSGFDFPAERVQEAWRKVLLNQFHDILPGSSIQRVCEEAEESYAEAIETARDVSEAARNSITDDSEAVTVFNSLSWPRSVTVSVPESWPGATDGDGNRLVTQEDAGDKKVVVEVPACGWTSLVSSSPGAYEEGGLPATRDNLENELIRATLNANGEITSLVDKNTGCEFVSGVFNSFRMFQDIPAQFDAWDIDSVYECVPVGLTSPAEIEVVASGPLAVVLRVSRGLHNSEMVQEITLRSNSRRVDFHTVIDWRERHKLLKVAFETNVHAEEALHEIQFGHIARPNHRSRPYDEDRFEVSNHKWSALVEARRGLAVLNDCKYGISVLHGAMSLTLLKSALAPDMHADRGRQEFTYAVYPWNGASLADSGVVREAYDLNVPATTTRGAAGRSSVFEVDADNIVIDTVKPAEDGSGDVIVRLYESMRTRTHCTLTTAIFPERAELTDMLERNGKPVTCDGGKIGLSFRAFEVKTLRLRRRSR